MVLASSNAERRYYVHMVKWITITAWCERVLDILFQYLEYEQFNR